MIKIFGMPTCPYCDFVHEQIKGREDEFEYVNIGENIRSMNAFIHTECIIMTLYLIRGGCP